MHFNSIYYDFLQVPPGGPGHVWGSFGESRDSQTSSVVSVSCGHLNSSHSLMLRVEATERDADTLVAGAHQIIRAIHAYSWACWSICIRRMWIEEMGKSWASSRTKRVSCLKKRRPSLSFLPVADCVLKEMPSKRQSSYSNWPPFWARPRFSSKSESSGLFWRQFGWNYSSIRPSGAPRDGHDHRWRPVPSRDFVNFKFQKFQKLKIVNFSTFVGFPKLTLNLPSTLRCNFFKLFFCIT